MRVGCGLCDYGVGTNLFFLADGPAWGSVFLIFGRIPRQRRSDKGVPNRDGIGLKEANYDDTLGVCLVHHTLFRRYVSSLKLTLWGVFLISYVEGGTVEYNGFSQTKNKPRPSLCLHKAWIPSILYSSSIKSLALQRIG